LVEIVYVPKCLIDSNFQVVYLPMINVSDFDTVPVLRFEIGFRQLKPLPVKSVRIEFSMRVKAIDRLSIWMVIIG